MGTLITSNISRLALHDSSFETIVRHNQNIELTFDWAKLENFTEQDINEPIIIGKTKMFLTGVHSEQFRVFDSVDNSKFTLYSLPDDLTENIDVIGKNDINDDTKTIKIGGKYKNDGKYSWAEWSFTFDTCQVLWTSFVTHTEWLIGKLPAD